jgi:hypothetical protein
LPAEIRKLEQFARLLDSSFTIPGTSFSFGLDAIIGLVPGIGDGISFGLSAYILYEALRLGVRKRTLSRMVMNCTIDALIGLMPVLGDLLDAYRKSNLKNIELLKADLGAASRSGRTARSVSALLIGALVFSICVVFLLCSTAFCMVLFLLI